MVLTGSDASEFRDADWDSYGHYRYRYEAGGAASAGPTRRTSYTDYNLTAIPTTAKWLTGTYKTQRTTETVASSDKTTQKNVCFNSNGLVTRMRTLKSLDSTFSPEDLITEYAYDSKGELTSEKSFGGDGATLSLAADLCALSLPATPAYHLQHEQIRPSPQATITKRRSYYADAAAHYTSDTEIDPSTGLVSAARDASGPGPNSTGLTTTFRYDTSGRLTFVTRPSNGWTSYTYVNATSTAPARVEVNSGTNGSSCVQPAITSQPVSSSIASNTTQTLSVAATPSGSTFQWYQGQRGSGNIIANQTAATFTTPALTATTSYYVKVSTTCGAIDSVTATVSICAPAAISQQPTPKSTFSGGSVTLSVTATGSNLEYQWYAGSSGTTTSPAPGGTGSSLTVAPTANTSYWVRVTSTCGGSTTNADSTSVLVTVHPSIAPSSLLASATSAAAVLVSWGSVSGAVTYEIDRSVQNASQNLLWTAVAGVAATSWTDTNVGADTAYLYRVRAVDSSGNKTGYSNIDVATTVVFADEPLTAGVTLVKASHFVDVRRGVDALRACTGQATNSWSRPITTGELILLADMQELRDRLNEARARLALPAVGFSEALSTSVFIKKIHIDELRGGIR